MRHLDLFSGIGGFALAARWCGWETVAFCEIEPYCQKVLRKHWPDVPIYPDVRELHGHDIGPVDVITAGYPCQPFSTAGKRGGENDDRHLWPEVYRLVREIRPQYALLENVAGHITMGLDKVLSDMEKAGYAWEPFVIPACAIGAWHRRDRIWIVAYTEYMRCNARITRNSATKKDAGGEHWIFANRHHWWTPEPDVGRVANGLPNRVDRLRGLGNAIVPQVAYEIMRCMGE